MPHKLYDCCDSNTCNCGRRERHGITGNRILPIPIENKKVSEASLEELEGYIKAQKNKEIDNEIANLKERILALKDLRR